MLDISALSAPDPKASQHLALQLVKQAAQQVENAQFLHRFRHDWVLRLAQAPQFLDVNPDYLLALDAGDFLVVERRSGAVDCDEVPLQPPVWLAAPG